MFNRFSHYLSYGSTDQATMRSLWSGFDGLLVPGTIAAFQAEGTRGFVLSLSAGASVPYVIDPRFPLFQNRLAAPKKSHFMLADVLGAPELVNQVAVPMPGDFTDALIDRITSSWLEFNVSFEDVKLKTFDKYARRLGEPITLADRKEPAFVLPPYVMAEAGSPWWAVAQRMLSSTMAGARARGIEDKIRPVVATEDSSSLTALLDHFPDQEVLIWVSNLDEFKPASELPLIRYGAAIKLARSKGTLTFGLYGGFFSVLLSRFGLVGASHGIGFGEHRDWVELPSSGAPPARFYVERLHRYISVDVAMSIWSQFPALIECSCAECGGRSPGSLDYHELMKHSVRVRSKEIAEWLDLSTADVLIRLLADADAFSRAAAGLRAPASIVRRAEESFQHLYMWARVLQAV